MSQPGLTAGLNYCVKSPLTSGSNVGEFDPVNQVTEDVSRNQSRKSNRFNGGQWIAIPVEILEKICPSQRILLLLNK